MKRRSVIRLFFAAQLGLLGIELMTHYDTSQRQIALAITNIAAVMALLWFNRWLLKRGSQLSVLTIILVSGAVWLDALGNFQHLYGGFWWWDRLTHAVGGMAISAGFIDFYQACRRLGRDPASGGERRTGQLNVTWGQATWLGFLVGQFLGAMYEVSEYLGDWWFQTERVRGIFDTPRDLLFNALGGTVVILLLLLGRKKELAA